MAQIWGALRPVCLLLLTGSVIPGWIHINSKPAPAQAPGRIQRTRSLMQPETALPGSAWLPGGSDDGCRIKRYPTVYRGALIPYIVTSAGEGSCGTRSPAPAAQDSCAGDASPTPYELPATIPVTTLLPMHAGKLLFCMQDPVRSSPRRLSLWAVVQRGGPLLSPPLQPRLQTGPTITVTATPSATSTSTSTLQASPSSTPTPTNRAPSATMSMTSTATLTAPVPFTPSITPSASSTITVTPTFTQQAPLPPPAGILINEIAWSGTDASPYDEWIELYNPGADPVQLDGWILTDGQDIEIELSGSIPAGGYFLLERTDDSTISTLPAGQLYTGTLSNRGEALLLADAAGGVIDTANQSAEAWPAGSAPGRTSMERICSQDSSACWQSCSTVSGSALDAAGNPIKGTPLQANSSSAAPTPTATITPDATPSLTPTASLTATSVPAAPAAPLDVLINEIAWAGSLASSSDEWIELHCPGSHPLSLAGWTLTDGGDITITLEGTIQPGSYYLLERTDDSTVSSILADMIYTGTLSNRGEQLTLMDSYGTVIDTAGDPGERWPAGNAGSRASMERKGTTGSPRRWGSFPGYSGSGLDASGDPIQGTPRSANAVLLPTPKPAWVPRCVVINEALMKPRHDWEGTGGVSTDDEFIELLNTCDKPVFLKGWYLDDIQDAGSRPFRIPGITLRPGSFAVFFRSQTHITLNDTGDDVRLLSPDMVQVNRISYRSVRAYNLSYGRLPDGSSRRVYGLWPTPGEPNVLYVEPAPEPFIPVSAFCSLQELYSFRLNRLAHSPAAVRMLLDLGLSTCPLERLPYSLR